MKVSKIVLVAVFAVSFFGGALAEWYLSRRHVVGYGSAAVITMFGCSQEFINLEVKAIGEPVVVNGKATDKNQPFKDGKINWINLKIDGTPEFTVWPGKQARFFCQGDEYRSATDYGNWRIEISPEQRKK